MSESSARMHLRRQLEAHLTELGYSRVRTNRSAAPAPEIARVSPVRGRIVYGETVLHDDLRRPGCHERLVEFSHRHTRRRSSILFFIGVDENDKAELEALLEHLQIRTRTRGGHVHVVPIAPAKSPRRSEPAHPPKSMPISRAKTGRSRRPPQSPSPSPRAAPSHAESLPRASDRSREPRRARG